MTQDGDVDKDKRPANEEVSPNVEEPVGEDEIPTKADETALEEAREKLRREREARAQALTLEIVGDLPYAEVKPPENVLFVCKLNPVTEGQNTNPATDSSVVLTSTSAIDEDLETIFSRFGTIVSCEVIRDKRTRDSLQYAFIEFENQKDCEQAYFKMQGVLIDDHRIHVDFSQSVSGKGSSLLYKADRLRRFQGSQTSGGMLRTQSEPRAKEVSGGFQPLRRSGSSGLRKQKQMTNANARMATEWCLTRTPYGKGVIGCLIRSQGSTREAAAPEDTTVTESGHLQRMIEEGETEAGTTDVMTMIAEGDGSDSNYNGSGLARTMTYETWITCMHAGSLGGIFGTQNLWK